jgi:hypothetical protein
MENTSQINIIEVDSREIKQDEGWKWGHTQQSKPSGAETGGFRVQGHSCTTKQDASQIKKQENENLSPSSLNG